ncbi:transposase [Prevotella pectinovora]|uniref:transposase n=1 Tax=Prevotella pectinovora TaxID=1602169 RepID=UPI0009E5364E
MSKKLYISLIFSNLVVFKTLSPNHRMYNLYTKFVKILEICKQFSENLVNESANYGDKGYIGADVQLDLFETAHIRLECPYRLNQKDRKPTFIPFAKARKRIETIFSQLTDQFLVIRNYAKKTNGLFARIIGKISALTILQYVNFINDKPIGRIKYALN